jgi:3-oxoacyl-[acyl-carrier-protein] synthase III
VVVTGREPGIGRIHCVLPAEQQKIADLPELASLGPEESEFALGTGIRTVGVFPEGPAARFAAEACQELGAERADVLLLVAPRAPDVLLGSDVTRVQAESGTRPGLAFTVDGLGCTGSSVAWGLAADLLAADPARESVLIAHASRPTGVERVRYPVTVIGDGAYAMTLVRGGRPALRAHRARSDGEFHDLFEVDYKQVPWYEWREECASPDRYRFELAMRSRLELGSLVDEVLADAGVGKDAVAATLMQNVTTSAYEFYESLLGLPIHPLCAEHLGSYGHLGAMDVVLNLDRLLASGELSAGDLVLVLNNSPVAAWAATLWEV